MAAKKKKPKSLRAVVMIRRSDSKSGSRLTLPKELRLYVRAQIGDNLILEEGSEAAAKSAEELGPYVIVRRAPPVRKPSRAKTAQVVQPTAPVSELPSLADDVQRKLESKGERAR